MKYNTFPFQSKILASILNSSTKKVNVYNIYLHFNINHMMMCWGNVCVPLSYACIVILLYPSLPGVCHYLMCGDIFVLPHHKKCKSTFYHRNVSDHLFRKLFHTFLQEM